MVVRKTIHNLRERPHHERRAAASAIAIAVVAILFLGWAILFFKNMQSGSVQIEPLNVSGETADQ